MRDRLGGLALIAAVALTGPAGMAKAEPPAVFSPIPRVVCDRKGWTCYDAYGASVPITRAHLGDQAAAILQKRLSKAGKAWNPAHFVLSNGVECWTEKRACFTSEGGDVVEPMTTRALFGERR